MSQSKKLIVNADDFGYSIGTNLGIVDCYNRGILTSTTIMPAMPGFDHAVGLAKENPGLGVGVHLTLTAGRPLLSGYRTLTLEDGSFPRKPYYLDEETEIDLDEVEREWTAQIERVLAAGVKPDHLDSHHHIHTYKGIEEVFYELARRYDLPVRNSWDRVDSYTGTHTPTPADISSPETLLDYAFPARFAELGAKGYVDDLKTTLVKAVTEAFETMDCVEVMCHPAYLDEGVLEGSSFNVPRVAEAAALTDPEVRASILSLPGITLGSYRSIL